MAGQGFPNVGLAFLGPGVLTNTGQVRLWDVASSDPTRLRGCEDGWTGPLRVTPDAREVVVLNNYNPVSAGATREGQTAYRSRLFVFDLASRRERVITTHGERLGSLALDSTGKLLVTGDQDGLVRVGPLTGEEPHLLYGQFPDQPPPRARPGGHDRIENRDRPFPGWAGKPVW